MIKYGSKSNGDSVQFNLRRPRESIVAKQNKDTWPERLFLINSNIHTHVHVYIACYTHNNFSEFLFQTLQSIPGCSPLILHKLLPVMDVYSVVGARYSVLKSSGLRRTLATFRILHRALRSTKLHRNLLNSV